MGSTSGGEHRAGWTTAECRSTLVVLVSGQFRIDLTVGRALLEDKATTSREGPGIEHSWQAEEDSVVLTVRWPSIPTTAESVWTG